MVSQCGGEKDNLKMWPIKQGRPASQEGPAAQFERHDFRGAAHAKAHLQLDLDRSYSARRRPSCVDGHTLAVTVFVGQMSFMMIDV